jgi:hypothetical protein
MKAVQLMLVLGLSFSSLPFFAQNSGVIINGYDIGAQNYQALQSYYGTIQQGHYWYDPVSGLWGWEGHAPSGFIAPNLHVQGTLKANASQGSTGTFINGRQINHQEKTAWIQLLGQVQKGRFWLDGLGNLGVEGGSYLCNVFAIARNTGYAQSHQQSINGNSTWRSNTTGIGAGSSGSTNYVIGSDFFYIGGT